MSDLIYAIGNEFRFKSLNETTAKLYDREDEELFFVFHELKSPERFGHDVYQCSIDKCGELAGITVETLSALAKEKNQGITITMIEGVGVGFRRVKKTNRVIVHQMVEKPNIGTIIFDKKEEESFSQFLLRIANLLYLGL